MRILLVGVSPVVNQAAPLLVARGHDVVSADTLARGLELAGERTHDVVLLDDVATDAPGAEACRDLRARLPLALLLALVGGVEQAAIERLLDAGASDVFHKGAGPRALLSRVELFARALSAEADALQSQKLIQTLVDGLPALISYVDRDETIQYVNRTYEDWYGKSSADMIGRRMPEVVPPERYVRRRLAQDRVMAGELVRFEEQLRKPDGSPLWMRVTLTPDRDPSGEVRGLISLAEDITELKVAQLGLREQRESLEVTLRSIGDAVIATDEELRVAELNPIAERLLGLARADALGRPIDEVFMLCDEDTLVATASPARRILDEGVPLALANHTALVRRDGSRLATAYSGAPIRDDEGRVRGVVLVFQDATERRAAERAVRESEERYRLLFETQPIPMFVYDTEGIVLDVNPALAALTGYAREEHFGRSLFAFAAAEDAPRLREEFLGRTAREYRVNARGRKKDGSLVPLEVRAFRIRYGAREAVLAFLEDQTERQRADERLRHGHKMEAIGRLSGGIAHDFNNMLAPILMNVDLLRIEVEEDDPLRLGLDEIRHAASRAAALARQLLAFSRKQVLSPVTLDLNAVVGDVERMLRRVLGEDVQLVTELEPDVGAVRADRSQVEQILLNLAANARDAMAEGGALTIRTRRALVDPESAMRRGIQPGVYVSLSVRDSGVGMDQATRERLFEPFFTTKPLGAGTGLGLATVYDIVRQSGGDVTVESELGQGTELNVLLPRTDAAPAPLAPSQPLVLGDRGTETVLLVEDEPSVRRAAKVTLERLGYTVLEAETGERGLELATSHEGPIDLVLTDVVMPGLRGPELVPKLALIRPEIKAILMSGYVGEIEQSQPDGLPFLAKPFTPQELATKLREVLGRA